MPYWTDYLHENDETLLAVIQKETHQMLDEKKYTEVFRALQDLQPLLALRIPTNEIIESRLELYALEYKLRDASSNQEHYEFPWKSFLALLKQTKDESLWKDQLLAIALKANPQSISIQEYYDCSFDRLNLIKRIYSKDLQKLQEISKSVFRDLLTFLHRVVENIENVAQRTYVLEQSEMDSFRKEAFRSLHYDPIEHTSMFQRVIEEARMTTRRETSDVDLRSIGAVHHYWSHLRLVLNRDYDIDWCQPSLLNNALFD